MNAAVPEYLQCSRAVIAGLVDTLCCSLSNNFPAFEADPDDIEMTLDVVRLLRPEMAELGAMEAMLSMQRGHWEEAVRILMGVIERVPSFPYARALLAFCLAMEDDAGWRRWADAALSQNPDRETRQLVRALEARDDLREAIRVYRDGGTFEIPLSISALGNGLPEDAPDVPLQRAGDLEGDVVPQQGCLRL